MKKIIVSFGLILISGVAFEQTLSKEAIKDFAINLNYQFRYGSGGIAALLFSCSNSKGYSMSDVPVIVETVETDKKNRELVFDCFYRNCSTQDILFNNLYHMGISAVNSKAIANYIYIKYSKQENSSTGGTN